MQNHETLEVRPKDARLYARVYGRGTDPLTVVMIPSLGRSARDFDSLGEAIAREGYTVAALDHRGIKNSTEPLDNLTFDDLVADVVALADALNARNVVAIDHAFGNGIVRRMAAMYPDIVKGVVAIAAGGKIHDPEPDIYGLFGKIFDPDVDEETRRTAIAQRFFADERVPQDWIDGWWPEGYQSNINAFDTISVDDWWTAGSAQILVIQGLQDRVAPPENGYDVKACAGDRATIVDLDGASHALLPEKPEAIETAVVEFLNDLER